MLFRKTQTSLLNTFIMYYVFLLHVVMNEVFILNSNIGLKKNSEKKHKIPT